MKKIYIKDNCPKTNSQLRLAIFYHCKFNCSYYKDDGYDLFSGALYVICKYKTLLEKLDKLDEVLDE